MDVATLGCIIRSYAHRLVSTLHNLKPPETAPMKAIGAVELRFLVKGFLKAIGFCDLRIFLLTSKTASPKCPS